jgi:ELWxxDGT repeat protein
MKTITLTPRARRVATVLMILLVGVLTTSTVFSQARLVKDINTSEYRHFNEYSQLTSAQGLFYFVSHGKELWKSDGTTQGTVRVKTLRGIQNLTLIGNTLYFAGKDENGLELWKSDGTVEGSVRVKDIRPGISGSTPKRFTSLNERIFFVANDGRGEELWKTDGTSTGTVLVKDIRTGSSGSKPLYLTAMNNMLFFSANDGKHGRELWSSDGSAARTAIVKNIDTGTGRSGEPQELVALNGLLFFSANHPVSGRELWKSDGTANGTTQLKDINPGTASSGITSIRRMNNAIYFNANNGSTGTALWRSTGTSAGTVMLKELTLDKTEHEMHDMTVINTRFYWLLWNSPLALREVWVSDGTSAGTRLVTTFENRETPARFTYMNNKVFYFSSYWDQEIYGPIQQLCSINPDGSGWREIWKMETPFSMADEDNFSWSLEMIAFKNAIIFPGVRGPMEGYKLLKTNGSETGLNVIFDTYKPTQSSFPTTMVKNNSGVYFQTQDNAWEKEHFWRTDGTTTGTVEIQTMPGIGNVIDVNNTIYLSGRGDNGNWQLWKTDGRAAGTMLLKEIPGIGYEEEGMLVNVDGTLFFYNLLGQLWKSDGTPASTILLKTFPSIQRIAASGSIAYIMVTNASGGEELWKSNGLSGGTVKVKTIRSVAGPSTSNYLTTATLGNIFYFAGDDGVHGRELWRTDGTDAGTFMVKDISTGNNEDNSMGIWRVTMFNHAIYINAKEADGKISLFRSDGTNAGTNKIYDSDRIVEFMPYNDQLLFISDGDYAGKLFATDGTSAGTKMLHELPLNYAWSFSHVEMNDILYFSFTESDLLWRTDGTACGTMALSLGVKKVDNLVAADDNLMLFSGYHKFYGEELFSVNVNNLPVPSCPEVLAASQKTSSELLAADETERVTYTPNPFDRDFAVIVNSVRSSTAEIVVHDMAGQPVASQVLETNTTYQLGSNWLEGIYIMRIYVDGKVSYKRVVKGRP